MNNYSYIMEVTQSSRSSNGTSRLVPDARHHAGSHVVEVVAVEGPMAGVVGGEGDGDAAADRHENRVAHRAAEGEIIDGDHLERVAVEMDRVRHVRAVHEPDLDALPRPYRERRILAEATPVEAPGEAHHAARQLQDVAAHRPGRRTREGII